MVWIGISKYLCMNTFLLFHLNYCLFYIAEDFQGDILLVVLLFIQIFQVVQ